MGCILYLFLRIPSIRRSDGTFTGRLRSVRSFIDERCLARLTCGPECNKQKRPKPTNLELRGVTIYLGRTKNELCPVAAFLSLRGMDDGPLFRFDNGHPLTRDALVKEVRSALSAGGLDASHYAGHMQLSDRGSYIRGGRRTGKSSADGRVRPTCDTCSSLGIRWPRSHRYWQRCECCNRHPVGSQYYCYRSYIRQTTIISRVISLSSGLSSCNNYYHSIYVPWMRHAVH